MAQRFLDKKTHRFYFEESGERESYVLIFGDEVDTRGGAAPSGPDFARVEYRGRLGEWEEPEDEGRQGGGQEPEPQRRIRPPSRRCHGSCHTYNRTGDELIRIISGSLMQTASRN